MSELETQFQSSLDDVKTLSQRPDNTTLLRLYGLFKQATVGDVRGPKPGMMDFVKRAKYEAWSQVTGTDSDAAKRQYVDLVTGLLAADR